MYPVPSDIPEEFVVWFKEGFRAGETRNVIPPRIAGEVKRLEQTVVAAVGTNRIVEATAALRDGRKRLAAYQRRFKAGQAKREKLKGGL